MRQSASLATSSRTWNVGHGCPTSAQLSEIPTFHDFADEWWALREHQWAPKTVTDYQWRLEGHLLPYFKNYRLDEIEYATVERYIAAKKREGLSPRSVNMTVTLLSTVLELAVERELIARNPAQGRSRRVRERTPPRGYIDSAQGIAALLEAAGKGESRHVHRRAILTVFCFAGLRLSELCSLRWRHVDLADGWLTVGEAKTDAGVRRVKIRGALRDELAKIRPADADPDAYVFATSRGRRPSPTGIGARIIVPAVEAANANLAKRALPTLPHLTPHSLRRTFASLLYALGESPAVVMAEMGHTSPAMALAMYARVMRRGEGETAQLRALVDGEFRHIKAHEPPAKSRIPVGTGPTTS
jgi:integrase